MGGAVGVGALGAEPGDRAPDQTGVLGRELLVADALLARSAAGSPDSTTTSTSATRRRRISGARGCLRSSVMARFPRWYAAGAPGSMRSGSPTLRWLDPQHVGAEIGEDAGAERAGLEARQVEDAQV